MDQFLPNGVNHLFIMWLAQWHDHAKGRQIRSHYVYKKALTSLERFPTPLWCAKDTLLLAVRFLN
jgi:crossover junction endonuclease MUS81